jgi:hypothetical protein
MKSLLVKSLVCAALLVSFAHAQQPQAATTTPPQASQPTDSPATIYIYRYKQFVGSALTPSVYCDDGELARMENGRFFVAKFSAGEHIFHSNDKQAGIDLDLKPGQDYYIRLEIATGAWKGHGRLILVAPEQGSYEIKNLKPLDRDKVKDSEHVVASNIASGN